MRTEVEVNWVGSNQSLGYARVLYAYLHPVSDEVLYVGKADRCTVLERMRGQHKARKFAQISEDLKLTKLNVTVGTLLLTSGSRFSSALLSDVESLLIMGIAPPYNEQSRKSRITRPGLEVTCTGEWQHRYTIFRDTW